MDAACAPGGANGARPLIRVTARWRPETPAGIVMPLARNPAGCAPHDRRGVVPFPAQVTHADTHRKRTVRTLAPTWSDRLGGEGPQPTHVSSVPLFTARLLARRRHCSHSRRASSCALVAPGRMTLGRRDLPPEDTGVVGEVSGKAPHPGTPRVGRLVVWARLHSTRCPPRTRDLGGHRRVRRKGQAAV